MYNNFINEWNKSHLKHYSNNIIYDDWLFQNPFKKIITSKTGKFLDLGCGQGNDTKYLVEQNKNVVSCDLSDEALKILKSHIPKAYTKQVDMNYPLDFENNTFDVIISDFSLQYFNKKDTEKIILELKRILKKDGYCILRLSSINDKNYGALMGVKLEENYYYVEKRNKRYFNEEDIRFFFKDWTIEYLKEKSKKFARYDYERSFYEVLVKCNK